MTIGKKIALGFTSVLLLTAILATIGVVQIRKVDTGVMDLAGVHIPLSAAISEIDASAKTQNLQIKFICYSQRRSPASTVCSNG